MLTPAQFTLRWQSEVLARQSLPEDAKLLTLPAQQLASVRLPEAACRFLREAGLPKACAPFLSFEEVGEGLPRIWERYSPGQWHPEERAVFEHYLLLGSDDDAGNPLCIDERDGRVISVEHELLFDPRARTSGTTFVNSGIPELAECLLVFHTTSPPALVDALRRVDPPAVGPGAFWSCQTIPRREIGGKVWAALTRPLRWKFW